LHASFVVSASDAYGGPIKGPIIIKGTNELEFSVTATDGPRTFTNSYGGTIDPGGTASGTWHNDKGGSGTWTTGNTFKCIGKAPVQGGLEAEGKASVGGGPQVGGGAPPPPEEKPPTDAIRMVITKQGFQREGERHEHRGHPRAVHVRCK
jgi:hypothetical protein